MMDESKLIDHVQAMKYDNWQCKMNEELKVIEKNKNWNWLSIQVRKQ